ncbi:MAG: metallophosphoesterase family protein [Clostridia bacterium]|nr:metallophosphoesterase family protein [Clostridia bacterium]
MNIGILSDTHGMLRPEAVNALTGCEAILHAGDIGDEGLLEHLAQIAPVYAVRGNADKEWAEDIPVFRTFEIGGISVCMTHKKKDLPKDLSPYDLAVFGHSHTYGESRMNDLTGKQTILLNPGSCGPRRFHQPITLARMEICPDRIEIVRIEIPHTDRLSQRPGSVDLHRLIETVMHETDKGKGPEYIAEKYNWDGETVSQVVRLYVTHPGVTAEGILNKMGK